MDIITERVQKRLQHHCFPQPENPNQKVWRYMDLAKFVNLISTRCLYFCRVDLLADTYEGSLPRQIWEAREAQDKLYKPAESGTKKIRRQRNLLYVNCWRIDDFESEAMWKLYCPQNDGIAIQTTYQKLVDSLMRREEIFMGLIKYIDYDFVDEESSAGLVGIMNNAFGTIMHKRRAFEHEKEIRLVYPRMDYWHHPNRKSKAYGMKIKWGITSAIENIYVNPYAQEWYYETIKDLVAQYCKNLKVEWSRLKSTPYF